METSGQITLLKSFLKKIQQLQGYGDMNSYVLAYEYKKITDVSDTNLDKIIDAFSSPKHGIWEKLNLLTMLKRKLVKCVTYKNYFG